MNCGVIELNTLSNSDWSRTKNDDFLFIGRNTFVFFFISSVEIWCFTFKFGGASIDHFVNWHHLVFFSKIENFMLRNSPKMTNIHIRKTKSFGVKKNFFIKFIFRDYLFKINQFLDFPDEKFINFAPFYNFFPIVTSSQSITNNE